MHYQYPIEQLARSASTRFQLGFARMALQRLPQIDDVLLEATRDGLRILGRDELSLAKPGEIIQQLYRDEVELAEPRVRFLYDGGLQEPIMWVRATTDRACCELAVQDLVAREAQIEEVDWLPQRPVIRALAPLRRLIGLPRSLAALSGGTADLQTWLSHYAPVPPQPGGHAA